MEVGEVLARYKPAERSVRIPMDGSIQSEIDEATRRLKQARRDEAGLRSDVPAIEEELAKLAQRADESSVTFKVAAVPGKVFDRLKYEHPPVMRDWDTYKGTVENNPTLNLLGRIGSPEFDLDAVIPKLVGLSIVEVDGEPVEWSEADGVELWDRLHEGARKALADAVWGVNANKTERPLSVTATGTTSNSGSGSTTSATKESPTPSTLDES